MTLILIFSLGHIFSRNCAKVDLILSNGLIKVKIMFDELNLEDSDGLGKQTVNLSKAKPRLDSLTSPHVM